MYDRMRCVGYFSSVDTYTLHRGKIIVIVVVVVVTVPRWFVITFRHVFSIAVPVFEILRS